MKTCRSLRAWLLALSLLSLSASLTQAQNASSEAAPALPDEVDEYAVVPAYDPLEPVNRAIFGFNDGAYNYVLRPVTRGYEYVVPAPARRGLTNFFANLRFPIRFVGSVLQGKFTRSGQETGKFVVNTVAGLGGFIRISDDVPALAKVPSEDIGQVFGQWGIGGGPYLVLPLLGPRNVRDAVGGVGDYFLHPLNWQPFDGVEGHDWTWDTSLKVTEAVNSFPELWRLYDSARKAVDPYVSVRTAYLQYRDTAVKQ